MKTYTLVFILMLLALYSFGQKPTKHIVDPKAIKLNNEATKLLGYNNNDSTLKGVYLLDKATEIDSNYYLAYSNKLTCLTQLRQYDKAIATAKRLIRFKPLAPDIYMMCGEIYDKINDTISSNIYFNKALALSNAYLDTMKVENINYDMFIMNKAVTLIMLNQQVEGNKLLKQLYNRQKYETFKEHIKSFMNKNKKELLEFMEELSNYTTEEKVRKK